MNKLIIIILLLVFTLYCYSENNDSSIHAEYCLAYDSTNSCGFWTSERQLKISRLIENVEFPKLSRENELCYWPSTNMYTHIGGKKIEFGHISAACMHCDIKSSLSYSFSFINPWQCYSVEHKEQFDMFASLSNKRITVEWEKIGFCKDFKDTIRGKFDIMIKGKCNEEDLEYNRNFDCMQSTSFLSGGICEE